MTNYSPIHRKPLSPLLNVGSSTREFRERTQPWMARAIFQPLAERGVETVHLDFRTGEGIDLRADLLDDADFARAGARRYRALLCCNILEHVVDAAEFARRCVTLVEPGGLILVTVPHSYPRHGDPIDTMYRPHPDDAAALFPETTLLAGEILDVGESYRDEVRRRPLILLRHLTRLPVPFLGFVEMAQFDAQTLLAFPQLRSHRPTIAARLDAGLDGACDQVDWHAQEFRHQSTKDRIPVAPILSEIDGGNAARPVICIRAAKQQTVVGLFCVTGHWCAEADVQHVSLRIKIDGKRPGLSSLYGHT